MKLQTDAIGLVTLILVSLAWLMFGAIFLFRSRPDRAEEANAARVIKGHELITQGPYAVVRNPIYFGMFGLVIETGLAFARW